MSPQTNFPVPTHCTGWVSELTSKDLHSLVEPEISEQNMVGGGGEHRPHVLDLKLGEQPTEAEGIRFSPKLHQDRCTRYRLFHHNSWLKALSLRVPQPRRFLSCWHRGNRSSLPLCLYVSSLYSCFLVLFFRDRISLVAFVGLKLVAIPLPPRLEC